MIERIIEKNWTNKFIKYCTQQVNFILLATQIIIYCFLIYCSQSSINMGLAFLALLPLLIVLLYLTIHRFPIVTFFSNCFNGWNKSIRNHFYHLDGQLCILIGIALIISTASYFLIQSDSNILKIFLAEQVSLYGIVDSYPQRTAYDIFLFIIIISAIIIRLIPRNICSEFTSSRLWPHILGVCVLVTGVFNLWTSNLGVRGGLALTITIVAAICGYFRNLRWIAWTFITILILCAMLPGWLHTPEPLITGLKGFDQHYDMVIYRGRQLAAGHLFFSDGLPYYSMLWSTLIGILTKEFEVPTFATLVRFVQAGQVTCLAFFLLAGWFRTQEMSNKSRIVALTFFAAAVVPWLSTDGFAVWLPNQSGFRFLMVPVVICLSFFLNKTSAIQTGIITGAASAFALIANFETGVVAMAGLGVAWLVLMRTQALPVRVCSALNGAIAFLGVFFALAFTYHYFFNAWPLPNDAPLSMFLAFAGKGFGGLALSFRVLVIIMLAHVSYKFIQAIRSVFDQQADAPDAMTTVISTMILAWFPYYFNRPDDWNLWTFIALYCLMIIPMFTSDRRSIIPFIIASLIVLPIAARNLPYFVIDPLKDGKWYSGFKQGCAGGLILPMDYCIHLQERAKTLRDFSSHGSVAWSTVLPLLTDQTAKITGPFWTGSLLSLAITNDDFNAVTQKIKQKKIDYLFFDDADDSFIKPRPAENSFNRRLFMALQSDYCKPKNFGGWLIAQRKQNGKCESL